MRRAPGRSPAALLALLLLAAAGTAIAQQEPPRLRLPIDCAPGEACWIMNHVDLDPGPGTRDYACGRLTYDGHNGVDFALRDLRAMTEGVAVLAAAAGTVAAVRDSEPDINVRLRGLQTVEALECGNGVRISHGDGWHTQYCHLRRGSIAVKPGDRVAAGDALGKVGLSGKTEFPHLHFTVRHGARAIDPFGGDAGSGHCGPGPRALWDGETLAALGYAPGSIYNAGVAGALPKPEEARAGALRGRELQRDAPLFAVWAEVLGVDAGDELRIGVAAPDGSMLIARHERIAQPQARIFRTIGRKRGAAPWPAGEYRVTISLDRAKESAHGASRASFAALVR